jgi:hypothetical protein
MNYSFQLWLAGPLLTLNDNFSQQSIIFGVKICQSNKYLNNSTWQNAAV